LRPAAWLVSWAMENQIMKAVTIALMIASALSQAARAEDAVPSTLPHRL